MSEWATFVRPRGRPDASLHALSRDGNRTICGRNALDFEWLGVMVVDLMPAERLCRNCFQSLRCSQPRHRNSGGDQEVSS
jgi:hypothetical protein